MEAMKADKVMKDNQLIEVKRAEERRIERERLLAQEATERRKSVVEDVVGSSCLPEAGGSSTQQDIEMVEVVDVQDQDIEDVIDEQGQDFMLVGESSEPFDVNKVLRRNGRHNNLFLSVTTVPYSGKEVAHQIKIKEKRRKGKIARGEMVDDDSDIELFGKEEEDEDDNDDDKKDDKDDKDDKGDDDDDQGASGLLIGNFNVQERIEDLLNDEINEQEVD
ncbi:putative uncharacterized protein DDB_G0270496 [Helianthus annuus]|uniref:putative uncharacterized protein DDB_G0270496 n=1 Tax=Helianthus annuus TaxID=4232 RepID=UPI000B90767F|nr:putative uncharacterized protein DDB_G0270496 [Helianthus annuus]